MTEIDVPDWVVEIAAKAIIANAKPGYVGELSAYNFADDALTAALGAWVVPVGRLNDSSPTLYTLRQEKPE